MRSVDPLEIFALEGISESEKRRAKHARSTIRSTRPLNQYMLAFRSKKGSWSGVIGDQNWELGPVNTPEIVHQRKSNIQSLPPLYDIEICSGLCTKKSVNNLSRFKAKGTREQTNLPIPL